MLMQMHGGGDHWPERLTWWARASADRTTGFMEANIRSYMDGVGYLNTFFETTMIDQVSVSASGTLYISGVVSLNGHAHIYGIAIVAGGYTVAYTLELWLIVDDTTSGTNLLEWKVNTWEDSETGIAGWLTDRGYDFDFDYSIAQTSMPVYAGHTYRVTVKLAGWAGATTVGIAASQAEIDFESDDYLMRLKWLSYDAPSDGGNPPGGCPILSVYSGTGYAEEGLLDIHNPDGIDQIASHVLIHTPEPVENRYLLRLTEHPQTYSHLDQVQLFAMLTNGTEIKLPLASAIHSEDGNVKQELLLSDDVRAVMLGEDWNNGTSQYIDLKFVAPDELEIETFTFIIEGHNRPLKIP